MYVLNVETMSVFVTHSRSMETVVFTNTERSNEWNVNPKGDNHKDELTN